MTWKIQSCIQLHPFNSTSKMLTPISSWNYGWKISKTNEKYERRLKRSTFAGRLVAVPGIAGNRSLRPQHRWRRHTDDEPSRLRRRRRRRRRTWRFGCRLLRPFVVWRPAAPVAPGKRRHAFPLEGEGIASKEKHYYPLESRNTKLTQRQCSNSTSKKATKKTFVNSKTQSRKKERKPLCWSKTQNDSLRTHTNTTTVKSSPHKQTNKQTSSKKRRRQKNCQFWPPKNTEKSQICDQFEAQHAAKTTGTKSQRKTANAPRESRPNGGDKNGSELELLQRSRWRQGLCLWAPELVWKSRDVDRRLWRNGWTRCARVVSGFMLGTATPAFHFINTNNSSLGWETNENEISHPRERTSSTVPNFFKVDVSNNSFFGWEIIEGIPFSI